MSEFLAFTCVVVVGLFAAAAVDLNIFNRRR